ncbi:MAG: polysaccharide deacetylase family protein [Candidatus Micrarchaeota archaeon]
MVLEKILSLIRDKRNPIYFPINYARAQELKHRLDSITLRHQPIDFALTFDVEYDFGSAGKGECRYVGAFLSESAKLLKRIPSTFFVQGNLVKRFSAQLRKLQQNGHEIGLHGYAHEPWGMEWFVKERIPAPAQRERLLKRALNEFRAAKIKKPVSFRAPNMAIDIESIEMLERNGFVVDSSAPSYTGILPIKSARKNICEIPVSVNPLPEFKIKMKILPHAYYRVFNMANLCGMKDEGFLTYVDDVVKCQLLLKQKPFLVFLAHPWEFYSNERFGYCSNKNYALLARRIELLTERFDIRFKTISGLC